MLIAGRSSQDCTLLREPRRALQARIAETLESQFAETAESQPEILARHCTEAGLIEKAAGLWSIAGQRSQARSALVEAVAQFTRALADRDLARHAGPAPRADQASGRHDKVEARDDFEKEAQARVSVSVKDIEEARKALEHEAKQRPYKIDFFDDARGPFYEPGWEYGSRVVVNQPSASVLHDPLCASAGG
jgi:hypothetical protein